MILDRELSFSTAQDLAQVAGTYLSEDVVDLRTAGTPVVGSNIYDLGRGTPVQLVATVVETFTSLGAATLRAQLVNAANEALSSSAVVLMETDLLALATLVQGYQLRFSTLPVGLSGRYLGFKYTIGTATMTAGAISAFLALDRQTNRLV